MKYIPHYIFNYVFFVFLTCVMSACGDVATQADQDAFTKLWISTDGNEYDLNLTLLEFNKEFPTEFRDQRGNRLCVCNTTFFGAGNSGNYILNCPSSCALQFSTLSTTRGSYTLNSSGILELCRNPSNSLLCREYK